jgi:MFS transporter, NNP family, nitrate/nitrite transporter
MLFFIVLSVRGGRMADTYTLRGNPSLGLWGATLGFFIGFAGVSLFGPTAKHLTLVAKLTPAAAGLLVSIPNLSGSLLRIPFSAWVDTTGGRKPFLVLLALSWIGVLGLTIILFQSDAAIARLYVPLLIFGVLGGAGIATFSVGISQTSYWFPQSKQGTALGTYAGFGNIAPGLSTLLLANLFIPFLGLAGSFVAWMVFLTGGITIYALIGRNAWYFQLAAQGADPDEARRIASQTYGQELFPRRRVVDSLAASAAVWQTWALVLIYFATFGGFIALTAWLPKYWQSFHGIPLALAGTLTAMYSVLAALIRAAGGKLSDRLGGERTAAISITVMLAGAVVMTFAFSLPLAVVGAVTMALGMGVANAAVFKLVPQHVPQAIGGAAGWVGGLGAFGGFVIPNLLALFVGVQEIGDPGYARGFVIFAVLAVVALLILAVLSRRGSTAPEKK